MGYRLVVIEEERVPLAASPGNEYFWWTAGDACPDTAACGFGDLPVQMLSVQEKDSPAAAWRGQQSLLRMAAFQAEKLCGGIGSGKGQRKF